MDTTYEMIDVIGPPSVKLVPEREIPIANCVVFLLLGPTGSGKSSFIEALANESLGISKDQLEGYTQELTVYRLHSLKQKEHPDNPILVIDTPGFADSRFPESKTLRLVLELIRIVSSQSKLYFAQILYFDRITDPRMAGSKGKLLDIFKAITGNNTGKTISIVTTMWDHLWREDQVKNAERRLDDLRTIYYKDFVEDGARVVQFLNTYESALKIVDDGLVNFSDTYFAFEAVAKRNQSMASTEFGHYLHKNLLDRKLALLQRLTALQDDLANATYMKANPDIEKILQHHSKELRYDLSVVEKELTQFPDQPPDKVLQLYSKPRALSHDAALTLALHPTSTVKMILPQERQRDEVSADQRARGLIAEPSRSQSAPPERRRRSINDFFSRTAQQVKNVFSPKNSK
ncbi:hypothetical protein CVT24_012043 [Panaeolus cyanescens]|uniref:G domain-containing protein n=1 Tax=Panaeolus cyanescens TaxID=181874 RepID=A0A409VYI9_9AGAR|nr:hypothetical protein CVT24_012043 [Panaeolus cyanescens]